MKNQHITPPVERCSLCGWQHHPMFSCPPTQRLELLDPATDRIEELTPEDEANLAAETCEQIGKRKP